MIEWLLFEKYILQIVILISAFFFGGPIIKGLADETNPATKFGKFIIVTILIIMLSVAHVVLADLIVETIPKIGILVVLGLTGLNIYRFYNWDD